MRGTHCLYCLSCAATPSCCVVSADRGRDGPDFVGVLVENHEVAVRLLPDNEPILRGKARLSEPDLLLPRGLLAVSQQNRLLFFLGDMW